MGPLTPPLEAGGLAMPDHKPLLLSILEPRPVPCWGVGVRNEPEFRSLTAVKYFSVSGTYVASLTTISVRLWLIHVTYKNRDFIPVAFLLNTGTTAATSLFSPQDVCFSARKNLARRPDFAGAGLGRVSRSESSGIGGY